MRAARIITGILFVLRRMHARIVGDDDDESCVDTHIRRGKKRIGSDVHADVLKAAKRTRAAEACADRRFQRNFFVRRPLRVNFVVFRGFLRDLRTGRSRISHGNAYARFISAARQSLVPQHQNTVFHVNDDSSES